MPSSLAVLLVSSIVALIAGWLLGWFSRRGRIAAYERQTADQERQIADRDRQIADRESRIAAIAAEVKALQSELNSANLAAGRSEATAGAERERAERLEADRWQLDAEKQFAENRATAAEAHLAEEKKQSAEKLALLTRAREELSNQFKALATEILEEKSKRFTEQNQANIGQLLTPLKDKITEFQARIVEVEKEGIAGRSELRVQIGQLKTLNERLSQDATNLVSALKGSSKVQGDWGEFILEGLLEASGLRKGHEYTVQESLKREDGRGARLDVVVKLPGGRHLVIDSKVSLGDYSAYCEGEDDQARELALGRHLASVRNHLRGLSDRSYQTLEGLTSPDFVVMFIPIEPAFMLAIARDSRLWNDAWEKNVLLVSPSTLLFVIRTVAHLWKQEQQTQNAKAIAQRGAELYDKFVGFVEDLRSVGARLDQAKDSYDAAYGKLSSGKGNLVGRAERLRKMGIGPKKRLPRELLASAAEEGSATDDGSAADEGFATDGGFATDEGGEPTLAFAAPSDEEDEA